jgi:hypothetical protein
MGHNRAGVRARQKLRRQRREELRLTRRDEAQQAGQSDGVVTKVKQAATKAVETIGDAVKTAADQVKKLVE